eukprot:CAMPEP_0194337682 /NCGR_PEP_ID=MMETSP0171-20130528/77103_1 /TAXON_ID=218684 /ORGANISM="Corethron pennatum, Strain L29A3" /LENGTH=242 /DNA_ID=CAMNT_0039101547 /DNA_START=171 /DNA_END=899 /DNA_ORIENTATION=+
MAPAPVMPFSPRNPLRPACLSYQFQMMGICAPKSSFSSSEIISGPFEKVQRAASGKFSSEVEFENRFNMKNEDPDGQDEEEKGLSAYFSKYKKMPPLIVDDPTLVLYDVLLLVNLSFATSTWVVHRPSFSVSDELLGASEPVAHIASAVNEGCLLAILWVIAGLFNGRVFRNVGDEPEIAAWEALNVFLTTTSLRLIVALAVAFIEHRPVGASDGESLIAIEVAFGFVMMAIWRYVYSVYAK